MRRVVPLLIVSAVACLLAVACAQAKDKAPKSAEELFAKMGANSDGLVTQSAYLEFAKQHHKKEFSEEKAKAKYDKILSYKEKDKDKGFDLAAFKAYFEAQKAKHKQKPKPVTT
jgi:hypothetical protein